MRAAPLVLVMALSAQGCGTTEQLASREDSLAETTRVFPGRSAEDVIKAAEAVLRQSDPSDFTFQHLTDGFIGSQRFFYTFGLGGADGQVKWTFTAPAGNGPVRASVTVVSFSNVRGVISATTIEEPIRHAPLYRLFWSRVDYVLGKGEWTSCDKVVSDLQKSGSSEAAVADLCGPLSGGKHQPPPPRI